MRYFASVLKEHKNTR